MTNGHDDYNHFAKAVGLAQGSMTEICSSGGDEELLFRLNDLVHNRYGCGDPHFYDWFEAERFIAVNFAGWQGYSLREIQFYARSKHREKGRGNDEG